MYNKTMSKKYHFTIYPESEPEAWIVPDPVATGIKAIACQPEICPKTGKLHIQGYVRFKRTCRIKKAKQLLKTSTGHLSTPHNPDTPDSKHIEYCTKEDTRYPGTKPVVWGEWNSQGSRTDLLTAYNKGMKGTLAFDESTLSLYARYPRYFDKCKQLFKGPPRS